MEYTELFEKIKKDKTPVEVVKTRHGYGVNLKGTEYQLQEFTDDNGVMPAVQFCLFHKLNYTVNVPGPSGSGYINKD
jgi:hypothetical protein